MTKEENVFRRMTSSLKPILTNEHKVARFTYCYEEIDPIVDADDTSKSDSFQRMRRIGILAFTLIR